MKEDITPKEGRELQSHLRLKDARDMAEVAAIE